MKSEKFKINLNSLKNVKKFNEMVNKFPNVVDVSHGRYILNGKSLLGLYSLDLSKDVDVTVYGELDPMYSYALENFNEESKEILN